MSNIAIHDVLERFVMTTLTFEDLASRDGEELGSARNGAKIRRVWDGFAPRSFGAKTSKNSLIFRAIRNQSSAQQVTLMQLLDCLSPQISHTVCIQTLIAG